MSLEIDNLKAEVITLQAQVELLEEYKRTNERYAPYSLDEEDIPDSHPHQAAAGRPRRNPSLQPPPDRKHVSRCSTGIPPLYHH